MRFVILLASNDDDARSNYLRLIEGRRSQSSVDQKPQYVVLNYDLSLERLECPKPEILQSLQGSGSSIQIDFIAHGNNNNPLKLLIVPKQDVANKRDPNVLSEITPGIVANFFKETVNKTTGKYCFDNLTLFCCRSKLFGQALSEKMPGVKITCFNEDIRIDHFCVAYNGQNQTIKATPHVFISGRLELNNEDSDEKKFEVKASVDTPAPASDTLSVAKPMTIRGDPMTRLRSQSVDSYLQTERKNNAQEQMPSTPEISHSSALRKLPMPSESAKENDPTPSPTKLKR